MDSYLDLITRAYHDYANYLLGELSFRSSPWWHNYLYGLIIISLLFFGLECFMPWHQKQKKFRKDFWLDCFYMFFNFFLFALLIYHAASEVVVEFLHRFLSLFGIKNLLASAIQDLPLGWYFLIGFVVRDFIQWWVHRLLHYHPKLWQFHKVHHSVQEMGFAAHLRYHWMETVIYRSIEYIPLALLGIGLKDFFIIHIATLTIGHFNHSNIKISLGLLKYIFNNPQMHIWHHAKNIPAERRYGVNFGLSLSVWDYLFKTAYIPFEGRDIELGFADIDDFPKDFLRQNLAGFKDSKLKQT